MFYLFLGIGFFNLFVRDLADKGFWIVLIIYVPLPIYMLIIKPYIEAKIYITKIELDENQKEIKIEYLKSNLKNQLTVRVQDLTYNIFNAYKITLADRIVFLHGENEILTQYSNSDWTINNISEVAQSLDKIGVMRPYGFNK